MDNLSTIGLLLGFGAAWYLTLVVEKLNADRRMKSVIKDYQVGRALRDAAREERVAKMKETSNG